MSKGILTIEAIEDLRMKGPRAPYPGGLGIYGDTATQLLDSHEAMREAIKRYGARHCGREDGQPTCEQCCNLFDLVGLPLTA